MWIFSTLATGYIVILFVAGLYYYMYTYMHMTVFDQAWGHEGWILAKYFFRVFMDRDGVESINTNENEASIQPRPNKLG